MFHALFDLEEIISSQKAKEHPSTDITYLYLRIYPVCLSSCLPVWLSLCLSIYLSINSQGLKSGGGVWGVRYQFDTPKWFC